MLKTIDKLSAKLGVTPVSLLLLVLTVVAIMVIVPAFDNQQ